MVIKFLVKSIVSMHCYFGQKYPASISNTFVTKKHICNICLNIMMFEFKEITL